MYMHVPVHEIYMHVYVYMCMYYACPRTMSRMYSAAERVGYPVALGCMSQLAYLRNVCIIRDLYVNCQTHVLGTCIC